MLRISLLCLFLAPALAIQVPLKSSANLRWQGEQHRILSSEDRMEWDINKLPHPNDTDHLVFETVYSLLQQWPNTRMRNGHNIIPGTIPKGTLLYRGSNDEALPASPDWVSTDPEHAFVFCTDVPPPATSSYTSQGCWHLTMVTTRALKVIYFDGSSAAKLPYGSMDTQDLLAWGEPSPGSVSSEIQRITRLCEWGRNVGVDGFVRMEVDFEVMLCDFSSGVDVASLANLVNWRSMPSMVGSIWFESINAGSWHNRFPGESRIHLNLAELVSFYDTKLVPSLIPIRAGLERWDHRVGSVSSEDLAAVKARLEVNLVRSSGLSSGFDWRSLFRIIVDRFSERLELAYHLLNTLTEHPDEILDVANQTHIQLRIMLTPYIYLSAAPTDTSNKTDLDWTTPVYKFCSTIHTQFLELELGSMTDAERLLLQAVQGTTREICRVVTKMWAAGVYAGIDPSLNTKDSLEINEISLVLSEWTEDLNKLMTWLDWGVWIKCNPGCGPKEICYLPTWPFGFPRGDLMPPDATTEPELDDWTRPQPKCISRIPPYDTIVLYN